MSSASFMPGSVAAPSMFTASETRVGKSSQKLRKVSASDVRTFAEHVSSFLRGKHPAKTAFCVECETGIPATTVRKWLEQGCSPNGPAVASLARVYGPDFLCAVFPDGGDEWFAAVARREEQARLERAAAVIRHQLVSIMRRG